MPPVTPGAALEARDRTGRGYLAELHPRRFFGETWRRIDAEAAAERQARPTPDARPVVAFALGAVCLTLMQYFGSSYQLADAIRLLTALGADAEALVHGLRASPWFGLYELAYWSAWRVGAYFVVPALAVKLLFRERLRDYGLGLRGAGTHAWMYGACLLAVLPLVALVSFRPDFVSYYPFYGQAGRSWADLIGWELLYAAQFFALEFFFRGFWLFAGKRSMGAQAITAMLVPYCMIHFGKPWLEALAAIVAGLVLGTLALRTRSIWGGVAIHVMVAVGMDLLALIQGDRLPELWWPPR